jgi:hypothetical protein
MDNTAHPDLVAEIVAFCGVTGMSRAAFGKEAMGDPRFVYDIEAGGRQCLPRTVQKARDYIRQNMPQVSA